MLIFFSSNQTILPSRLLSARHIRHKKLNSSPGSWYNKQQLCQENGYARVAALVFGLSNWDRYDKVKK